MKQSLSIYHAENGFIVEIHNDAPAAPVAAPPVPYGGKYKNVFVFADAASLAEFVEKVGEGE